MQRPESCGASAALELWPLAGREGADSGESCRLLLEEAFRLPQLRGKAPRLVLSPAGSEQATAAALDMLRPLVAAFWPGLEPEALPAVPGPGDLARLAGGERPVLLLQPRPEDTWEGMLLARREAAEAPVPEAAVVSMPDMPTPSCEPG